MKTELMRAFIILSIFTLCFACFSCSQSPNNTSSVSQSNTYTENKAKNPLEQKTPAEPTSSQTNFPHPPNTYQYRVLWLMDNSFKFVDDSNGNLTARADEVDKGWKMLQPNFGRFDLSKQDELSAYGNYVGQTLKLTGKERVLMKIASQPQGKSLFCGQFVVNDKGTFEFIPEKTLSIRGFVAEFSVDWDEKEIEAAKRKQKQSGVLEIKCP